ncbi:MAG TPA: hypothetical protein VGX49_09385 [Jatrophihabitans sp.]|jgi:hypothetical protein|nr:hypothetical protein [Jatrophihabitans sp.]
MPKILAILAGCSLIAGLCTTPQASAAPAAAGDRWAGSYTRIAAKRVLDTRSGLGGYQGLVSPGHTVTFTVSSAGWQAAVIDVTVPAPAPAGSLSVYPGGTTWDGRVTMTLTGGGNIQQQLTVALGAGGGVTIRSNAARPTHLIVDVLGYYAAGTPVVTGMFGSANGRVLDTRNGIGAPRAAVGAGKKVTVALAGRGGIPAGGAIAVVADVAVLAPRSTGQLVITDGDGSLATTRLRFVGSQTAPQTMQTERVVMLGSDGRLSFTNSSASSVQLVVDVFGYFLRGGLEPDYYDLGYYIPLSPQPVTALTLRGRTPVEFYPPGVREGWMAANLVMTTDQPAQPVALGIYAPYANYPNAPWSGSPVVSSSAWLQPTELTVDTGVWYVMVRNLKDTDVALHCYVTGYYWVSPGI